MKTYVTAIINHVFSNEVSFTSTTETICLPVILASNTVVQPFTMMVKIRNTLVTHRAMFAFGSTVEQRIQ